MGLNYQSLTPAQKKAYNKAKQALSAGGITDKKSMDILLGACSEIAEAARKEEIKSTGETKNCFIQFILPEVSSK